MAVGRDLSEERSEIALGYRVMPGKKERDSEGKEGRYERKEGKEEVELRSFRSSPSQHSELNKEERLTCSRSRT